MFLSKILFDTKRWETIRALENRDLLHKKIMGLFPTQDLHENMRQELGILFRVEGTHLLLQSKVRPEGSSPGFVLSATKEVTENFKAIKAGNSYRFRLEANTSRRFRVQEGVEEWVPESGPSDVMVKPRVSKARGCRSYEERGSWLEDKAEHHGFMLDTYFMDAKPIIKIHQGVMEVTCFDGVLKVTNIYAFQKALLGGIGRGKSYGLGLLSIRNA